MLNNAKVKLEHHGRKKSFQSLLMNAHIIEKQKHNKNTRQTTTKKMASAARQQFIIQPENPSLFLCFFSPPRITRKI
jgi:hypothetical protein